MRCDSKSMVHRYPGKEELWTLWTSATNSTPDFGHAHSSISSCKAYTLAPRCLSFVLCKCRQVLSCRLCSFSRKFLKQNSHLAQHSVQLHTTGLHQPGQGQSQTPAWRCCRWEMCASQFSTFLSLRRSHISTGCAVLAWFLQEVNADN